MSGFIKSTKEENQIVIIETDGYLNNEGGEAISTICYEKMNEGKKPFLIELSKLLFSPIRCVCPIYSLSFFGRMRSAKGI